MQFGKILFFVGGDGSVTDVDSGGVVVGAQTASKVATSDLTEAPPPRGLFNVDLLPPLLLLVDSWSDPPLADPSDSESSLFEGEFDVSGNSTGLESSSSVDAPSLLLVVVSDISTAVEAEVEDALMADCVPLFAARLLEVPSGALRADKLFPAAWRSSSQRLATSLHDGCEINCREINKVVQ